MSEDASSTVVVLDRFSSFASPGLEEQAPLYARLARVVADSPDIAEILLDAPPTQRLPVLLFASVHWLLLAGSDHELTGFYPDLVDEPRNDDPAAVFRDFCDSHRDELRALVASRTTQTNEVGRSATLLPFLAAVAQEVGPLSLVDVGSSGGLNLHFDAFGYRYGELQLNPGAAVQVACEVSGDVTLPSAMPPVAGRRGLDRDPVDVSDPDAARWLEACVWPDEVDRIRRLRAAVAVAVADPVPVHRGDAATDLPPLLEAAATEGHPVVTNSWVLNYLTRDARLHYLASLEAFGRDHDLTWLSMESPSLVDGLPRPHDADRQELTVVTLVRWRDGVRHVTHPADTHPHGQWLHGR